MKRILPVLIAFVTLALVVLGILFPPQMTTTYIAGAGTTAFSSAESPDAAVRSLLDNVRQRIAHARPLLSPETVSELGHIPTI